MSTRIRAKRVAVFQTAVGVGLVVYGAAIRSSINLVIGLLLLGVRAGALLSKGESLSWMRGELDERRQHAVDRSYRVAFMVLAFWVTALSVLAASRSLPMPLWPIGIVVAVVAALTTYALTIRRA